MTSTLIILLPLPGTKPSELALQHRTFSAGTTITRFALQCLHNLGAVNVPISLFSGNRLVFSAAVAKDSNAGANADAHEKGNGENSSALQAVFPGLQRLQHQSILEQTTNVQVIALAARPLLQPGCFVAATGALLPLQLRSTADERLLHRLHGLSTQPRMLLLTSQGTVQALLDGYYTSVGTSAGTEPPKLAVPPAAATQTRIVPIRRVAPHRGVVKPEKIR